MNALPQGFWPIVRFYTQKRLLAIFIFGIASGFPWVMIGSAMSAWLNESGISRSAIGYFGAVYIMYSINFLWSPLVDRVKIPMLRFLGQRRSWILWCQLCIAAACFALSFLDLTQVALTTAGLVALFLAGSSATQDIAIDAFRIDSIGEDESHVQAAGAAMATSGWWTGFAGLGSIPFLLSELPTWSWNSIYQLLSLIMLGLMLGVWFAKEPESQRQALQDEQERKYIRSAQQSSLLSLSLPALGLCLFVLVGVAITLLPGAAWWAWSLWFLVFSGCFVSAIRNLMRLEQLSFSDASSNQPALFHHKLSAWLIVTLISPLHEFFKRNGVRFALSILLFLLLFKVGEAFLGRMSIVFYQEVGFTNKEIAIYSKLLNWWVTIVFSLIGSYVTMRMGIVRGLFIGGTAMAASNLFFALLAVTGPKVWLLATAVTVDGFTSAWSTVAFVALISLLTNRAFTASQYALMASIATLGRTLLGSYSGALVDFLQGQWAWFFIMTTIMVLPSLLFLWSIRHQIQALEQANQIKNKAIHHE